MESLVFFIHWEDPFEPGCSSTPCIGDGNNPTFNDGNPYNGYTNPYYWVDDHPLLYRNNASLDPGTFKDNRLGSGV